MARRVLNEERILSDGTRLEAVAYSVESSDECPEGVKYSFQYYDPRTDKTLLRYDNSHKYEGHETAHHKHRHGLDTPVEIEYEGSVRRQYEKFLNEVDEI